MTWQEGVFRDEFLKYSSGRNPLWLRGEARPPPHCPLRNEPPPLDCLCVLLGYRADLNRHVPTMVPSGLVTFLWHMPTWFQAWDLAREQWSLTKTSGVFYQHWEYQLWLIFFFLLHWRRGRKSGSSSRNHLRTEGDGEGNWEEDFRNWRWAEIKSLPHFLRTHLMAKGVLIF